MVILGHDYQRRESVDYADFVGDSYQLSMKAASAATDYVIFCGVTFMAESAVVLKERELCMGRFQPDAGDLNYEKRHRSIPKTASEERRITIRTHRVGRARRLGYGGPSLWDRYKDAASSRCNQGCPRCGHAQNDAKSPNLEKRAIVVSGGDTHRLNLVYFI